MGNALDRMQAMEQHNRDEYPPNKRQRTESPGFEHPLPTDPNAKKIIGLNDLCLEKIFEYLNFQSLFNVAIANEFLRPAAARVYKRRFGRYPVLITGNSLETGRNPIFVMFKLHIDQLKSVLLFLRCFGAQLSVLEFDAAHYIKKKHYEYVNQYINKYCSENLVSLTFESVPKIDGKHFPKPFVNVTNVTAKKGSVGRYLPSFAEWFPNMRHLKLIHVNLFQHRLTALHFPHLEHLIVHPEFGMQDRLNPKDRKLMKLETVKVEAAEMQRFVNNHPHLVELDLPWYQFTPDMANNSIRQLTSLTKFRFHFNASQYERFVSPLKNQWNCSNQPMQGDNICVTLEKRTQ